MKCPSTCSLSSLASGMPFPTTDEVRLLADDRRCAENSESLASEGWTDIITSLERYAILATA